MFSYEVIWPQSIIITYELYSLTSKTMSKDPLTQFRWKFSLPTPIWNQNYTNIRGLEYDFLHILLSVKTINIVFYKTKTIWTTLIKIGIHIIYINLKILYKFQMIWPEINGHMNLWPVKYKLILWILYRFPVIYTYFNTSKNI